MLGSSQGYIRNLVCAKFPLSLILLLLLVSVLAILAVAPVGDGPESLTGPVDGDKQNRVHQRDLLCSVPDHFFLVLCYTP